MKIPLLLLVAAFPAIARGEPQETAFDAVEIFLRALHSGESDSLINAVALPFQYRDMWTAAAPGSRPYRKCEALIKKPTAVKAWRDCVDRWIPGLYSSLEFVLASPPVLNELKLATGNARAPRFLRTLARTLSLRGVTGEWISGMIGPDIETLYFLFFVTRVDGHPRVAAFLHYEVPCRTGRPLLCRDWKGDDFLVLPNKPMKRTMSPQGLQE
jgi:hypothetical protein